MKRRDFVVLVASGAVTFGTNAAADLKLPSFKKKKSKDVDWSSIIALFNQGLTGLASESGHMGVVIADIAEVVGLKEQADLLRAEAANIEKKGDSLGADDLDVISEKSASTVALIEEKLKAADELSEEQKAKITDLSQDYVSSLLRGTESALLIREAAGSASKGGSPSIMDGTAVLTAKDIPVMAPKAVSFIKDSYNAGQSLFNVMESKGVPSPDTSELEDAFEELLAV